MTTFEHFAEPYVHFAAELADAARPLALSYFRTPLEIVSKLDESPVDRKSVV